MPAAAGLAGLATLGATVFRDQIEDFIYADGGYSAGARPRPTSASGVSVVHKQTTRLCTARLFARARLHVHVHSCAGRLARDVLAGAWGAGDVAAALLWAASLYYCSPIQLVALFFGSFDRGAALVSPSGVAELRRRR